MSPFDTALTQVMTHEGKGGGGLLAALRRIMRERGVGGFYAGWTPILLRGVLLDIFQFSAADALRQAQMRNQSQASLLSFGSLKAVFNRKPASEDRATGFAMRSLTVHAREPR